MNQKNSRIKQLNISTKIILLYIGLSAMHLALLIPALYFMVKISFQEKVSEDIQNSISTVTSRLTTENIMWLLIFLIPGYLMLAAISSYILAKRTLKPVHQITMAAKSIKNGDLSGRIDGVFSHDEVGELADTFNQMISELDFAFKRERQFTSDASHELRTPMTVITACAEDALCTDDETIIRENLRIIQAENQRMRKMLSQLLMLSRGYEGRWHFESEHIFPHEMADSVAEALTAEIEKKKIHIYNEIPKTFSLYADQSLFTQLLVNLMENAVKYGNENGSIWLTAFAEGRDSVICVRDNGIGIGREDLSHIFERFYRADKARDRNGSGLGLSIVKWIVELHSGSITVNSKLGKGTLFRIVIPK